MIKYDTTKISPEKLAEAQALAKELIIWVMLNLPEEAESMCSLAIEPDQKIPDEHMDRLKSTMIVDQEGRLEDIYSEQILAAQDENGQVSMSWLMSELAKSKQSKI